jgi:hypothetical protein
MEMRLARIPVIALAAALLVCALTGVVFACSGPRAGELIEHNRSIVNVYGVVSIFLFLATVAIYFVRGRSGVLAILLSLVIGFLHPFWHYGGGGGDCGSSFVELAKYVTIILGGILIIQVALWRLRSPHVIVKRT